MEDGLLNIPKEAEKLLENLEEEKDPYKRLFLVEQALAHAERNGIVTLHNEILSRHKGC